MIGILRFVAGISDGAKRVRNAVGALIAAGICIAGCTDMKVNPELAQLQTDARLVGVLAPKSLSETGNDLTIGCETLDRDYADYHKYKENLEQLGVRKIRLMAGWAKTEKEKGVYDWAWLDSIIDDAVSRGLEPWLETSYGNPIYEGGGTKYLAGGWPTSPEAIEAWNRWVGAMALRYRGKVHEWEIWNEPDINKSFKEDVTSQVELQIRTAEIIRSVDPEAKIAGFAWAGWRPELFDKCMTIIQERGKLGLFDWISYHFYHYRPEDMYVKVDAMREALDKYSERIILRQGETGAPSKGHMGGALSDYDWSEVSQGKWALRRMLSDHGRGIATTIFCISDMNYFKDNDHIAKKNVKGLLETDDDNNVLRRKQAYYAVQNLVSVWDALEVVEPAEGIQVVEEGDGADGSAGVSGAGSAGVSSTGLAGAAATTGGETDWAEAAGGDTSWAGAAATYSVYRYREAKSGLNSIVLWEDSSTPDDRLNAAPTKVTVPAARFKHPVCVDIRTGCVYKVRCSKDTFYGIPVYDSPVIITDRSLLKLR